MTDRDKVIQELGDSLKNQNCGFVDGVGDVYAVSGETIKNIISLLKEQEAVVRCKDCKHYSWHTDSCDHIGGIVSKNFFCADGKRKEGEQDA